jgi:hypothetical protein
MIQETEMFLNSDWWKSRWNSPMSGTAQMTAERQPRPAGDFRMRTEMMLLHHLHGLGLLVLVGLGSESRLTWLEPTFFIDLYLLAAPARSVRKTYLNRTYLPTYINSTPVHPLACVRLTHSSSRTELCLFSPLHF